MQNPSHSSTVQLRRFGRRFVAVLGAMLVCLAFASVAFAAPPNLVISDSNMRATQSMTAADVQAFLDTKNGPLKSASFARHDGGASATAAVIIWEACQQWGIGPRVMLTMLQKEQSLIDNPIMPNTLQYRFDWAVGMGVPDSGNRNYTFQGFGNQLWYSAMRLDGYGELKPGVTYVPKWKGPGDTTWMPSGAAPDNIATWKLYVYNPSLTGNSNFYKIYLGYFGDPTTGFSFTPITGPACTVYRFYNAKLGSHYYTANVDEANSVQNRLYATLRYEGPAYIADQTKNTTPLYRFYNKKNGSHFYTVSVTERDNVYSKLSATYQYDGPAFNVSAAPAEGAATVYRFFNKKNGTHFYTASETERDSVVAKLGATYTYEGGAFYLMP
ncbi:MAG: hypothetical protein WCJ13_08755 [Coriobacteriia bacterium]